MRLTPSSPGFIEGAAGLSVNVIPAVDTADHVWKACRNAVPKSANPVMLELRVGFIVHAIGNDEGAHLSITICPPVTTDFRATYPNSGAAVIKVMIPIVSIFIAVAP